MKSLKSNKILIVTDTWLPQVNGVVSALQKTIKILEKDYKVIVVHPGLFNTVPLLIYPEIKLAVFPARKMRRIFEEEKPDYVHISNEGPLGLAARAYCLKNKIPFTTSFHTHFPLYVPHYMPVGGKPLAEAGYRYLSWFHNASVKTMAASKSLKEDLESHGFKHVVICPLGVDTDLFKRNEKAESRFKGPVFVYFGRIAKEKGLEEFFTAKLPGTKLVIGDGPARKSLEKKYGKEAVFVGYKKGQELIDLLSISDVFVLPSVTETFGLVVVEALACGLPVAAHDVMGPRDVVTHGVEGFLSENLEEAAKASLKLKGNYRKKALQFSWQHSADAFLKHLVPVSKAGGSGK
jgi:glycosyltransferase involved in cell wall biosynthesis